MQDIGHAGMGLCGCGVRPGGVQVAKPLCLFIDVFCLPGMPVPHHFQGVPTTFTWCDTPLITWRVTSVSCWSLACQLLPRFRYGMCRPLTCTLCPLDRLHVSVYDAHLEAHGVLSGYDFACSSVNQFL
jgi:hypothetical protein